MKIAVLGCGTVGSGVVDLIDSHGKIYAARCGEKEVIVKYILDLRELKGTPYESRVIHDVDIIAADPEIDVAVEMMGGTEPAFSFCKKLLEAGKGEQCLFYVRRVRVRRNTRPAQHFFMSFVKCNKRIFRNSQRHDELHTHRNG